MNPFVNPKKRGFLLPKGCKDLIDVLQSPAEKAGDPILTFTRLMLLQAEGVGATEILIPAPMIHEGECTITQRIGSTFDHVSTVPADVREGVVKLLLQMAGLFQKQFPVAGTAILRLKHRLLKWNIRIDSAGADCVLTPSDD